MTMNLDELRDWHVKRLGWRQAFRHRHASGVEQWWWERDNGDECQDHPVPATLDAIAGLMPPNWEWCMDVDVLEAYRDTTGYVWVERTGDELTDRARLAWLAWEAEAKGAAE
jgi:hypothetical protein